MTKRKALIPVSLSLVLGLWSCTEPQPPAEPAAEEQKPPEPIDGQTAFFRMFPAARNWSPDAQGLRLENLRIEEVEPKDGKYGAWRATFYSPSKNRVAVFNYSVVEVGGKIQKGVFQDHEEAFTSRLEKPWPVAAFKVSSEKAYQVALSRKETKAYVKKNPDTPVNFLLEQTNRHPNLAWRIYWGERLSTSDFSVFVDASTGDFLEIIR